MVSESQICDDLLALEREFWSAAGDPDFYEQYLARDAVMAFHVGVMSRDEVVNSMVGAPEWKSFTIDDPRCVVLTDDVASLTYTTRATSSGEVEEYRAAITSVYVLRSGRWRLMLHQQTPLA